jgi:lipoate-protein ligase A
MNRYLKIKESFNACTVHCLHGLSGFWLPSRIDSGKATMALDSTLLKKVCKEEEPMLLLRAYAWREPTLSLGVNQLQRDLQELAPPPGMPLVRRPTGGRAIWHGEDYSYAFLSNAPALLQLSVRDSYCVIRQLLQRTLFTLGVETEERDAKIKPSLPSRPELSQDLNEKPYQRSAECFATRMPDDLTRAAQKIAGSAQLRQAGGLLQHGSLFLKEEGISFEEFANALRSSMEKLTGESLQPWRHFLVDDGV